MQTGTWWTKRLWVLLLILVWVLAACDSGDEPDPRQTFDEKANAYESSLREEFNWLWERMTYLQTDSRPDTAPCEDRAFAHAPATLNDEERKVDDLGGKISDRLVYAEQLLKDSHQQWRDFCSLKIGGSTAYAFLSSRLTGANDSLTFARQMLDERARSRAKAQD
jgi:hypothetical protein